MQAPDNSNPHQPTRAERREKAAADALRSLIRDILLDKFPLLEAEEMDLPLNLSLCLRGNELSFEPDLRRQVLEQAEAFLKPRETFLPGAVYDFHEQRPQRPPDALAVFAGYDPVGHPKWSPVSAVFSESANRKIFSGKELKTEQLREYGKDDKRYNILGQVILGPLPVPKAYQQLTGCAEWALTLHIVETRDIKNHFALQLNLLAGNLLPEELDAMIQELPLRDLNRAVLQLQEQVLNLENRAREAWIHQDTRTFNHALQIVPRLLGEFSAQLAPL